LRSDEFRPRSHDQQCGRNGRHRFADIDPGRGIRTFLELGLSEGRIVVTESEPRASDAPRSGKVLVTPDALLLTRLDGIEANVEATGFSEMGA